MVDAPKKQLKPEFDEKSNNFKPKLWWYISQKHIFFGA